jgi:hypothetical protein
MRTLGVCERCGAGGGCVAVSTDCTLTDAALTLSLGCGNGQYCDAGRCSMCVTTMAPTPAPTPAPTTTTVAICVDTLGCSARGLCVDGQCVCEGGYGGQRCETYSCDFACDGVNGRCVAPNRCACEVGYDGALCVPSCQRCGGLFNGGVCVSANGTRPTCVCRPGFGGPDCQVERTKRFLMSWNDRNFLLFRLHRLKCQSCTERRRQRRCHQTPTYRRRKHCLLSSDVSLARSNASIAFG